uniref:Synaptonemal complex central element protein 3 n=1 Tax=Mastacembelus armatus TaxID=205130 RepID=A0A3Q3MCU9_9TELE
MANSPSLPERLKESDDDVFELIEDLERMIEDVENISVLLSWMSYDIVTLRANPEVGASMRHLEEAYRKKGAEKNNSEIIFVFQ